MMLSLVLTMAGLGWFQENIQPTESELRRARQMLVGPWTVTAATDDGEVVGPELLRRRLVKDGRVTISPRTIVYTVPDSDERHVVGFKINPARLPREIDLITVDERVLPGIYKVEGERLMICFTDGHEPKRPTEFESTAGSSRVLLHLDQAEAAGEVAEEPVEVKNDLPVPVAPTSARQRATPGEIARDRDLMAGLWEVVEIVDDGEILGPEIIRQKVALDGRLRIGSRGASITSPLDDSRKLWAYRIDPATNPREIDLVTSTDAILKGIYRFDDDRLLICAAKDEDLPRPTTFDAATGSRRALYTLRIVKERHVAAAAPAPAPQPVRESKPVPPTPAELKAQRAEQVREMLLGSWTTTDSKGTLTIVVRSDGSFTSTRKLDRKRLFSPSVITSDGSWSYANGIFTARVARTTDSNLAGYTYSNRIQSISPSNLVIGGGVGPLRTYRRL